VQQLGLPAVVALNMADEAARFGVSIHAENLSAALGQPVLPLSAKYRQGLETLQHTLLAQLKARADRPAAVPEQLEERLAAADADLDSAMAELVQR
jgi:ferrous iron transport protein B